MALPLAISITAVFSLLVILILCIRLLVTLYDSYSFMGFYHMVVILLRFFTMLFVISIDFITGVLQNMFKVSG